MRLVLSPVGKAAALQGSRVFAGSKFHRMRSDGWATGAGRRLAGERQFCLRGRGGANLGCGMQWLTDLLPFADKPVVQIGFLAACGIAALVVLAILYRFVFAHRLRVPGGRTRQPRLGLVDAFSLDGQRQLVLVRRDNVEHLIMIGGPNDVLVEAQINRALAAARENNLTSAAQAKPAPPRRAEPLPAAPPASAPPVPAAAPPAARAPSSPSQPA